MREIAATLLSFALLAGATALAVQRGDRELFVPPPDAVVEAFVREVVTGRYDRAREYLEKPESMSEADLRALRERLGEPTRIEAELVSRADHNARATVRLESGKHVRAVSFALAFDNEWKIVR